jgi:hypothetical protein
MACKIDRGSAFNCASIAQAGIGNYVILINKEDFDDATVTEDGTTKEITAITFAVTAPVTTGFAFESSKGSVQIIPSSPLRAVTSIDGFDHTLDIRALDASQLSRDNIAKMRFQKVVAIVPLASGKALVYGRNVGMRISDFQENPGDADTGGTIQFVLKTPDNDPPEIAPPHLIASSFDISTLLPSV